MLFLLIINFILYTDGINILKVKVYISDIINIEEDKNYGVGDDGFLTETDEVTYYYKQKKLKNINDHDLTTSSFFEIEETINDTINIKFNFKKEEGEKLLLVKSLEFFNGKRNNLKSSKYSNKVKKIEIVYNGKLVGEAQLKNIYKLQEIVFQNNSIKIDSKKRNSMAIIIKDVYKNSTDKNYHISEIKFQGN